METNGNEYRAQWDALRRLWRRYLCLSSIAVVMAAAGAAIGFSDYGSRPNLFNVALVAMFVGVAAAGFSVLYGFRIDRFRCPRCHRRFNSSSWSIGIFSRQCAHCGLPRGAS